MTDTVINCAKDKVDLQPVPHGLAQCAIRLDQATPAAVGYLTTVAPVSLDHWNHLVGICYRFVAGLFLKDDFGDYIVEGKQHDELTGLPKPGYRHREGTIDLTRQWIGEWLSARFSIYHERSVAEIEEAADRGEFRYLGKQCRNALIDKLRKRELVSPEFIYLDTPVSESVIGGDGILGDSLGTWNGAGQSSLHQPRACQEEVMEFIEENKEALADVMIELMAYVQCIYADGTKGDITQAIADGRNVKASQARMYKRLFLEKARRASHPVLRELFRKLQPDSALIFVKEPKATRAIRLLRSQALADLVDFEKWCREAGISSKNSTQELQDLAKTTKEYLYHTDNKWVIK